MQKIIFKSIALGRWTNPDVRDIGTLTILLKLYNTIRLIRRYFYVLIYTTESQINEIIDKNKFESLLSLVLLSSFSGKQISHPLETIHSWCGRICWRLGWARQPTDRRLAAILSSVIVLWAVISTQAFWCNTFVSVSHHLYENYRTMLNAHFLKSIYIYRF